MRTADLIGGAVVLVLGLAILFFSSQMDYYSEFGPGPGFLPLWVGIFMTGSAIYVTADVLRRHGKAESFFKPRTKLGVKMLITIVVTFLLLPMLGFSIGLALFTGFTMRTMGRHRWISCGVTVVLTAIGIHFIFGRLLYIPLPGGIIGW